MQLREMVDESNIITLSADPGTEIRGISFDTRTLRAGDLFVAVKGYERDGHMFIGDAVSKGAVCVLCEDPPAAETPYALLKDTRKALAAASAAWFGRPASKLKMIGVTGTNGKTTVTSIIKQILEKLTGMKAGLIGTNGNIIGDKILPAERTTPESYEIQELLAMMVSEGCKYAVMEVSSHALQLNRVYGIEFDVGIFTNLSPDHLDFHDSMEEYAKAKAAMFLNTRHAAINIDDKYAHIIKQNVAGSVLTYSLNDDSAGLVAKDIDLRADKVGFSALTIGRQERIELNIPGIISVYNALSALSAAMLLGFGIESAAEVIKTCDGVKGRMEVVPTDRGYTVLIDYAHTPDALENIIKTARGFAKERVITLFGCGGARDKKKRPLMGAIASSLSDLVVVTTDNPRTEEPAAIIDDILAGMKDHDTPRRVIENRREAIHWALGESKPGDVLILAGKGHETYQIFGKEKTHFDEREVVAEYFE